MQPGVGGQNEVAGSKIVSHADKVSPVQYFRKSGIRTICWSATAATEQSWPTIHQNATRAA